MAISQKSVGSWAVNNAATQTVTLPTHAAGDMLIVRAGVKPYTATPHIDTAGWAPVADGYADGAVANGDGVGSVKVRAWWKEAASAAETNPVITWDTTSAPGMAVAVVYQKGASESWLTPIGDGGPDTVADTSKSITIQSHVSVTAGDMVDFFYVVRDNATCTSPTITQAGVTFGTVGEYPSTAGTSTTSNDIAADGGYRLASSGTSSAAAVITGTLGTSETAAGWQTRLRVATIVWEYCAGTSDAAATAEAAVTRQRGLAGTAAEASDASLASPTRSLALAGTAAEASDASAVVGNSFGIAGTSAATSTASGSIGLPRALAGTSAAAASPTASLKVARPIAGTSDAVATGAGSVVLVRRIAGTAAAEAVGVAELTEQSGNIKAIAGTAASSSDATAVLLRLRDVAIAGTAGESSSAEAIVIPQRGLQGATAASGAATGDILRDRSFAGAADSLSDATASMERVKSLAALADAIASAGASITMDLGLAGTSAASGGIYGDTYLTVTSLERRRWDGTQWNPGELYRRRWTQT